MTVHEKLAGIDADRLMFVATPLHAKYVDSVGVFSTGRGLMVRAISDADVLQGVAIDQRNT